MNIMEEPSVKIYDSLTKQVFIHNEPIVWPVGDRIKIRIYLFFLIKRYASIYTYITPHLCIAFTIIFYSDNLNKYGRLETECEYHIVK